jgi:hypothetical protein
MFIDIAEKSTASIFQLDESLQIIWKKVFPPYFRAAGSTVKLKVIYSYETSLNIYGTVKRYFEEDSNLQSS